MVARKLEDTSREIGGQASSREMLESLVIFTKEVAISRLIIRLIRPINISSTLVLKALT